MHTTPIDQAPGDIDDGDDQGWSRIDSPPVNAPFTSTPGFQVPIDDFSEIDFFKLFIPDYFLEQIVTETNRYAHQETEKKSPLPQFSRLRNWKDVSLHELKVFFGLIVAMGMTRKMPIDEYWSTDETNSTPLFSKMMAKDRFLLILANLHLVDNEQVADQHDPLFKVRPIVSLLQNQFSDVYKPEQNLSFDEATCPFKGRIKFRVYNPAKPNRFGIKIFQVCEASSGYCVGFDIYHGSTDCIQYTELVDIAEDCTTTTKIVVGLLARHGLLHDGYRVYLDNYYNSPELATELDLCNTYICGTLRINRKNVPKVFSRIKKLLQGDTVFRRKDNILIVKYHDKRDVHMISTFHAADSVLTNKVDRNGVPILKPVLIVDYCKEMGGVDLNDQVVQYYECLRKTVKWWVRLFFHLFNLALVNAFLLYRKTPACANPKRSHLAFRQTIIKALFAEATDYTLPGKRGHRSEPMARLAERHFPSYIPAKEGAKRQRPLRNCVACNLPSRSQRDDHKRKQTSFMCMDCDVALCVPQCFTIYHSVQNYKAALRPEQPED